MLFFVCAGTFKGANNGAGKLSLVQPVLGRALRPVFQSPVWPNRIRCSNQPCQPILWLWLKSRVPNDPQEWSYLVENHLFGVSIILSHTHIKPLHFLLAVGSPMISAFFVFVMNSSCDSHPAASHAVISALSSAGGRVLS